MALIDGYGNHIEIGGESSWMSDLAFIRKMNDSRHAFRIATFNVKGSGGFYQNNWPKLAECLADYGVDICGLQEVYFPLQNKSGYGTFAEYFTSEQFPYVSDNGDAYGVEAGSSEIGKNERMMLSRYPIDSTTETYYKTQSASGDYRYLAKSVISLPRYMDKRGSEKLKLSVYNTQLEVINPTTTQAQAREIVEIVAQDENPFIIIMGDTNDFTLDKEVWKIFEEAGFTTVVSTNTSTVAGTYDFNCIDNFFLSKRIKALNHNVVWGQDYPWSGSEMLSDHDLVIADVELDYSDIRCVNYKTLFCSVQTSTGRDWLTEEETMTVTITPYDGYELSSVSVRDTMVDITSTVYANGVVTLTGADLRGDVFIDATAVKTESSGAGVARLKDGTYSDPSGWSVTVSNGNHVVITAGDSSLRLTDFNISDIANGTTLAADTELFVIPAGSTVESSVSIVTNTSTEWTWCGFGVAETGLGTQTTICGNFRKSTSVTRTFEDELSVGAIYFSIRDSLTANATLEFDINIVVNGTTYV
jgi:endonuclease/exonuclease/phosphatase family metal-dependent hydrolase